MLFTSLKQVRKYPTNSRARQWLSQGYFAKLTEPQMELWLLSQIIYRGTLSQVIYRGTLNVLGHPDTLILVVIHVWVVFVNAGSCGMASEESSDGQA